MRKVLLLLVALATCLSSSAQLLYRISGNGLNKDSYILGTYHMADGSFVEKIPGAMAAFESAEQVCGEVVMSDLQNPDSIMVLMQGMMIPDGKTLKDFYTEEEFARLNKGLKEVTGMDLTIPQVYQSVGMLKPAVLLSQMVVAMCAVKEGRVFDLNNGIDTYLQQIALAAGKGVIGFESLSFQMQVAYGSPVEMQARELLSITDDMDKSAKQLCGIVDAYYAQNIEDVNKLMDEEDSSYMTKEEQAAQKEKLIDNRNRNWIKAMPAIMKEKPTLFVVGAGHLSGDQGVLKLLQNNGYTVKAVE